MNEKKYICVEDLQGGRWGVGRVQTIEEWRETALEWCIADGSKDLYKLIKKISQDEVIETISDFWELEIVEFNENNRKHREVVRYNEEIF